MAYDQTRRDQRNAAIANSSLLNALGSSDLALLETILEPVYCHAGKVIYEPGDLVHCAYFPCGESLASFRILVEDGTNIETALIGREGAVGGIVSQGRLPAFARCVVQFSGPFLKADTAELNRIKLQSPTLNDFFARYADCLVAQIFQATACNAAHTIDQRASKWLVSAAERTGNMNVTMTQEQLAGMLGVGRSYVNRVLRTWKDRGILTISRGKIHIRDIAALNRLSCDCDEAVRRHFDQVLAGVYPENPAR